MARCGEGMVGRSWLVFARALIISCAVASTSCSGPSGSGGAEAGGRSGGATVPAGAGGEASPTGAGSGGLVSATGQAGSSVAGAAGGLGGAAGSSGSSSAMPECRVADDCTTKHTDHCLGAWRCELGTCAQDSSPTVDCSMVAATTCHDVQCDPDTGDCIQVAAQSAAPCGKDFCTTGTCVPGAGTCRAQVSCSGCTICDATAQACLPKLGFCSIAGQCVVAGALKAPDTCLQCNVESPTTWSPVADGTSCKSNDTCFVTFQCGSGGMCQGAVPVAPSTPLPARPISGARTGSLWAPAARATLRPLFVWSAPPKDSCTPVSYDLQVDDSCGTVKGCAFPSPEISVTRLSNTSYRPDADLKVSSSAPVGRRYYWRVRACRAESCSDWSSTRYVDVGRAAHDYNGDGYTDLNFSSSIEDVAGIFYGSAQGPAQTVTRIATDRAVSFGDTGDVNGDGFDDLLLLSTPLNGYFGSAQGLPAQPNWQLASGGIPFVEADFDGDGYDDAVISGSSQVTMSDYFAGQASGLPAKRSAYFINPVPGNSPGFGRMRSGDFNGDGLADLAGNSGGLSIVYTYVSGNGFPMAGPNSAISGLAATTSSQLYTAIGDTNGDFRDDIAIVTPRSPGYAFGVLYLYRSQGATFPGIATLTLPDTAHASTDAYGGQAVGGDLMGRDGLWDLVVTAPQAFDGAKFYIYGGSALQSLMPLEIYNPSSTAGYWFGSQMQVGDVNGDGDDDLVVCDFEYPPKGRALVYYGPLDEHTVSPSAVIDAPAGFETFCSVLN